MPSQKITWTTLPNGLKDGKLRLSVFVSPRLDPSGLQARGAHLFGSFVDWPAAVNPLSFNIVIRTALNGTPITLPATRVSPDADSALWAATFPATTFVRRTDPPAYNQFKCKSYPAQMAAQDLKVKYVEVATQSPFERPIFKIDTTNFELFRPGSMPALPNTQQFFNQVKDIKTIQRATSNFQGIKNYVNFQQNPLPNAQFQYKVPDTIQQSPKLNQSYERVAQLETILAQNRSVQLSDQAKTGMSQNEFLYVQAIDFYNRRWLSNVAAANTPIETPRLDFHEQLGALADYPEILRKLGIVIDLEVDLPQNIPPTAMVAVDPGWSKPAEVVLPSTWYLLDPNVVVDAEDVRRFVALPKYNENNPGCNDVIKDGLLCLGESCYDLVQIDLDSGTSKMAQEADQLEKRLSYLSEVIVQRGKYLALPVEEQDEVTDDYEAALPSLRSGGFGVARKDRSTALAMATVLTADWWAKANTPSQVPGPFNANDLLRGYRIDVYDEEQQQWFSLCERRGRYKWIGKPVADALIEDEGYVKVSAVDVVDDEDENKKELYIPETLFQWDGWSLVAERPGLTILEPEPNTNNGNPVGRPPELAAQDRQSPLDTNFIPIPGSLPRLRYGKHYRLRARTVDLAGNSISKNWQAIDCASESECYARYEPVLPPVLLLRRRVTEGESAERLVIRSNYDQSTQEYVTDPETTSALSGYEHNYTTFCDRHIAPPKTSQLIAEMHGAFDPYIGSDSTPAQIQQGFNIARKEEGMFHDTTIWDPTSAQFHAVANIELVTPPSVPDDKKVTDLSSLQQNRGTGLGPGQYVLHTGETVEIPYIPDVIARGAAFQGLPGMGTNAVKKQSFNNVFPDAVPFRLRVVEVNGQTQPSVEVIPAPEFQENGPHGANVLVVRLPKAAVVKVKLSCYVDQADLDAMGLWCWMTNAQRQSLQAPTADGRHWMITPDRELTLVHAVQQPLEVARFAALVGTKKKIGDTLAWITGTLHSNVPSTGQVDVLSDWMEAHDDVNRDLPQDGRAGNEPMVPYVSRVFDLKLFDTYPDDLPLPVPASVKTKDGRHRLGETFQHDFGDTKYREVRYHIEATTRFRDYFPPEIYNDREKIIRVPENDSHYKTIKILNSARPAAPKVKYVVPTFGWENKELPEGPVSRRCGGGLRVYLDRPWYSSGDGELLGVVVRPSTFQSFQFSKDFQVKPDAISDYARSTKFDLTRKQSSDLINNARKQPIQSDQLFDAAQNVQQDNNNQAQPQQKRVLANLLTSFRPSTSHPSELYTTQWGMDPIWHSVPPTGDVVTSMFPNAVRSMHGLSLEEATGMQVSVAGHEVQFDPVRKLWYCDIHVNTGDTYYPFIRLALARLQPNSIANAHLSRIVLADFIQPVPDRVAAVTFSGEDTKIVVSGVFGLGKASPQLTNILGNQMPSTSVVSNSRRMEVTIEKKPELQAGSWAPVSDQMTDVAMDPLQELQNRMIWMKSFKIPEEATPHRYRAVVREYEFVTNTGRHPERLVYADAIEFTRPK